MEKLTFEQLVTAAELGGTVSVQIIGLTMQFRHRVKNETFRIYLTDWDGRGNDAGIKTLTPDHQDGLEWWGELELFAMRVDHLRLRIDRAANTKNKEI